MSTNNRTIKQVIRSQKVNMGGILLEQPLPNKGIDQIDPFLLIHHWDQNHQGGKKQSDLGVGPHPHRGFSPVTFIYKGGVKHRDSIGNNSIVTAGGTQWMHGGSGIVHSERPVKEIAENGGQFEIIQFWVNTPATNKMDAPMYFPLQKNDTPVVSGSNNSYELDVITGEINGVEGPITTFSPMLILNMRIEKDSNLSLKVPGNFNALIYILDGELSTNTSEIYNDKTMLLFNNDGNEINLVAKKKTRAILLSGEPLNEPVESYGPMVMNTNAEIIQALNDFQDGKMGNLIENFN